MARYGERAGTAAFTVWMPEMPLMVHVEDKKLSQIRGWRVPDMTPGGPHYAAKFRDAMLSANNLGGNEDPPCSIMYQQTPVQVRYTF